LRSLVTTQDDLVKLQALQLGKVKNMKFKLALGIAALALSLSPARATTYDYAVDFAIGVHAVTGSIQTDCNNCVLSSSDLSSYQFFLDGANGFSSSDPFISLSIVGSSLALQLPICFEVRALSGGLMSSTPE
jgi:hypothetical protein